MPRLSSAAQKTASTTYAPLRKSASALPVHMNGRIYDPLLGRFLSADIAVQLPGDLQAYNRYSYVMNRPLTLVDPSGWYFMEMMPQWAQGLTTALTLGLAPVVDHGIDSGIEAKSVYNTVRSDSDGVATASVTAAAVAITRFTGAMDWAEAVQGEKIVVSNGSASTTAITDPKEIASKAVGGAAGMVLTAVGGAKSIESRLDPAASKTGNAPEVPEEAPTREFKGGPHSETKLPVGDGLESHHMPPDSVSPVSTNKGSAIQMDPPDHAATSSHGSQGAAGAEYRKQIGEMVNSGDAQKVRNAYATEVKDVRAAAREVSGDATKYNKAMQQMLEDAKKRKLLQ